MACGACLRELHEPSPLRHAAGAPAGRAGFRRRPWLRARTSAGRAGCLPPQIDLHGLSEYGVLEVHLDGICEILAFPGPSRTSCPISENIPENILEASASIEFSALSEPFKTGAGSCALTKPCLERCMAELVVLLAFFRIREDLVGGVHLLEFLLCRLVPGIHVRMELPRLLPEGLLYLLLCGVPVYPKDLVEILLCRSGHTLSGKFIVFIL